MQLYLLLSWTSGTDCIWKILYWAVHLDLKNHLDRLPSTDFVECSERTVVNGKVWREGRWAVPEEVYDAEKYPNYCNGPCYLMPKETSQQLFDVSKTTASDLQADDALITGVLRTKLEIPIIQVRFVLCLAVN